MTPDQLRLANKWVREINKSLEALHAIVSKPNIQISLAFNDATWMPVGQFKYRQPDGCENTVEDATAGKLRRVLYDHHTTLVERYVSELGTLGVQIGDFDRPAFDGSNATGPGPKLIDIGDRDHG